MRNIDFSLKLSYNEIMRRYWIKLPDTASPNGLVSATPPADKTGWIEVVSSYEVDRLNLDCGDNSCRYAKEKGGMRTNGGCRCQDKISRE